MKCIWLLAALMTVSGVAQSQVDKPQNTVKLTSELLNGKTWTYAHKRASEFGDVVLRFDGDKVSAKNNRSSSTGVFTYRDDFLCITFRESYWGQVCAFVVQDASGMSIVFPSADYRTALKIE